MLLLGCRQSGTFDGMRVKQCVTLQFYIRAIYFQLGINGKIRED